MKKFKFSLDTVLAYKQQALDAAKAEHGAVLARVREQEAVVAREEQCYREYNLEYRQRKEEGLTIGEAAVYQNGLRAQEMRIQREIDRLETLKKQEEEKRAQMIEAKKESASLEKLREQKLDAYNKAVQKSEEAMIDELISRNRAVAAAGASA